MPIETNPAEYLLDLINTDVVREGDNLNSRIGHIHEAWVSSTEARTIKADIETAVAQASNPVEMSMLEPSNLQYKING